MDKTGGEGGDGQRAGTHPADHDYPAASSHGLRGTSRTEQGRHCRLDDSLSSPPSSMLNVVTFLFSLLLPIYHSALSAS
jgi:hypothetical protein